MSRTDILNEIKKAEADANALVVKAEACGIWLLVIIGDYETLIAEERRGVDVVAAGIVVVIDYRAAAVVELSFHAALPGVYIDLVAVFKVYGISAAALIGCAAHASGDRLGRLRRFRLGRIGAVDIDLIDVVLSGSVAVVQDIAAAADGHGTVDHVGKLLTEIEGRPTARFMFFNGLSRTRTTGNISYLHNENLDVNLAFSFQMQLKAAEYYPGLTRKIYLKGYRYNMHLKDKFLLVELGAQNNTLEEAKNACDPLAHILDMVLSGEGG